MLPGMLLPPRISAASVQPTGPVTQHTQTSLSYFTSPVNIFICYASECSVWMDTNPLKKMVLDILKIAKLNNLLQCLKKCKLVYCQKLIL